jgi:hypothetical protein
MLEYLLLRAQDRAILEASAGALRWIVLDEAHSYVGSQAAEMALLLRRVRAAFGVTSQQVTLMATSATIGGEVDAQGKLRAFLAALAGQPEDAARVIEGRAVEPDMPQPGADTPINATALAGLGAAGLAGREQGLGRGSGPWPRPRGPRPPPLKVRKELRVKLPKYFLSKEAFLCFLCYFAFFQSPAYWRC